VFQRYLREISSGIGGKATRVNDQEFECNSAGCLEVALALVLDIPLQRDGTAYLRRKIDRAEEFVEYVY
jgi:hypothetical protein